LDRAQVRLASTGVQQAARERLGTRGRNRNFEAILAGIAGAADEAVRALDPDPGRGHEHQLRQPRRQARQHGRRPGPLEGEQRVLGQWLDGAVGAQVLAQVRQILFLAGAVDHQEQMVAGIGDHKIVEDAAAFVGEQRVALAALGQADHVDRHQAFQRRRRIITFEPDLAHVGDVEQAGRVAGVLVLLDDAVAVLDRHLVAGKGHHTRAQLAVQRVQRRLFQFARLVHGTELPRQRQGLTAASGSHGPLCPRT